MTTQCSSTELGSCMLVTSNYACDVHTDITMFVTLGGSRMLVSSASCILRLLDPGVGLHVCLKENWGSAHA